MSGDFVAKNTAKAVKSASARRKPAKSSHSARQGALVSIVTPVFNAEKYLEETVKSVQTQTYSNWELFLINDGSTDNSLKIAKNLAKTDKRIKVISIKNSGAAVARNTGIEQAKGDYLCFIDADDLWKPEKLEKQLKFMQEKDCEFSFTSYAFADEKGQPTGKAAHVPASITYKQALKNTTIFTSTVMFNLNRLSKKNIMMPNVKSEDTATWWKILKNISKAYGLNKILTIYRRPGKSLSSNKVKAIKRIWYLYRNVEHLNFTSSLNNFSGYCFNAIKRRV
ncbi:glycosyltransferase family 2 protein [Candidatus Saccharibacteria bacterium]|nr:glycosyltransferase family 2 protein [Candidatus Saccharibacteria bacterium]